MGVLGFETVASTPEEFAARIKVEIPKWAKVLRDANIKAEPRPLEGKSVEMPNYQVKNVEPVVMSDKVQVRLFTLAHGDLIPWHNHSESTDQYFVLEGVLTIETRDPDDRRVLTVGQRYKILPGTAHCVSNESPPDCQFLLVQGVGKYDLHKADVIGDYF
jgi:quercetin dioxygenase-like cupin family protein